MYLYVDFFEKHVDFGATSFKVYELHKKGKL